MKLLTLLLIFLLGLMPSLLFAAAGNSFMSTPGTPDTSLSAGATVPLVRGKEKEKSIRKELRRMRRGEDTFVVGFLIGLLGVGLLLVARFYIAFYPVLGAAAGILGFVCTLAGLWMTGIDFTRVMYFM